MNSYGITMEQAKALRQGQIIHVLGLNGKELFNRDGTPMRFKVTSVKTWKRSPDRIEIHVQRGLREFYVLDAGDLSRIRIPS